MDGGWESPDSATCFVPGCMSPKHGDHPQIHSRAVPAPADPEYRAYMSPLRCLPPPLPDVCSSRGLTLEHRRLPLDLSCGAGVSLMVFKALLTHREQRASSAGVGKSQLDSHNPCRVQGQVGGHR